VVFGVITDYGSRTLCSTVGVLDEGWHHIAVERRRRDHCCGLLRRELTAGALCSIDLMPRHVAKVDGSS